MKWLWAILEWVLGRLFGGGSDRSRNDAKALGAAENELKHAEQDAKDREKLAKTPISSPDAAIDSLRRGEF